MNVTMDKENNRFFTNTSHIYVRIQIVFDNILTDTPCSCNIYLRRVSGGVKTMGLIIVVTLLSLGCVKGQFFEDRRCRCVCPSPAVVLNTTNTRQIYTGNVPPNQCNCEGVVFPLLRKELEGKLHIFCPRCECVYQTRNTTLIMAIVFMILMGLSMSVLYIVSFTWLNMLVGRYKRNRQAPNLAEANFVDRDFVREHRGEFESKRQRERQLQRKLELERKREMDYNREQNRRVGDENPGSEEEGLLEWDADK